VKSRSPNVLLASALKVIVWSALMTVCAFVPELPLKFESPA